VSGLPLRPPSDVYRRLPAGVIDSALASLATFATGLAAVALFDDVSRGVYAVFFTAFGLGAVIPAQLTFAPLTIVAVSHPMGERLALVPRGLPMGLVISAASSVAMVPALLVTGRVAGPDLLFPMALTCGAAILVSPSQDYVRRMLHTDGASWVAATVSAVQLTAAVAALSVLYLGGVPVVWIPFGALAIANLVSLVVGVILATRRIPRDHGVNAVHPKELWGIGSWLFGAALVSSSTQLATASIVTILAGPEAIGYAEAARVVSQPVLVLGVGLTSVLAPRVMEAAVGRAQRQASRLILGFIGLIAAAAVAYVAVAGWEWSLNPMAVLVPAAYVVPWLVTVTVAANVLQVGLYLPTHELGAARRQRALAMVTLLVAPIRLAISATAGTTGAFARPLSLGAGMLAKAPALAALRRRYYAAGPTGR
jgi:O-antigen/teichoic acid export membrane protein